MKKGLFAVVLVAIVMVAMPLGAQSRGLQLQSRSITGNPTLNVGRQIAVIIGIDKYTQWTPLRSAVNDAKSVKRILEEKYFIDEFIERYDDQATALGLRRLLLQELPAKVQPDDSVFIYYAGHGFLDDTNTGFWIPVDGGKDIIEQSGWLGNQQIRNAIGGLKAKRVLVVADSCFSGDLINVSRGAAPQITNSYFARALTIPSRQVLTSGASETVPDQSEFAQGFRTALERNTDPVVDPHTLFDRVRTGITKTQPLYGTLPGNEQGGTFAFFLRPSYGRAQITVQSVAKVFLNGSEIGTAEPGKPLDLTDIPVGTATLRLVYADSEESKSVSVGAGSNQTVAFTYKPIEKVTLRVSVLTDAQVYVDGTLVGSVKPGTPLDIPGIAVGERQIGIVYADNQESRSLALVGGRVNTVAFTYQATVLGSIRLAGFPDGAIVSSGGRELGVVTNGELVVQGLSPGPRSFQVFTDAWSDPMTVRGEVSSTTRNTVNFTGGKLLIVNLPSGSTLSINGKVVRRTTSSIDRLDLGLWPVGPLFIQVSAPGFDDFIREAEVRDALPTLVPVSLQRTAQTAPVVPPNNQSGTALANPSQTTINPGSVGSLGGGFAGIRIRPNLSQVDGLEVQLRRVNTLEPLEFSMGQLSLVQAGDYIVEARKSGDPDWAWQTQVSLAGGLEQVVQIPLVEFSKTWNLRELNRALLEAQAAYTRALNAQNGLKTFRTITFWTGVAGLALAGYSFWEGTNTYQAYKSATDLSVITDLRNKLLLMNTIFIGSSITSLSGFGLTPIGFLPTGLPRAQGKLDQAKAAYAELEAQE